METIIINKREVMPTVWAFQREVPPRSLSDCLRAASKMSKSMSIQSQKIHRKMQIGVRHILVGGSLRQSYFQRSAGRNPFSRHTDLLAAQTTTKFGW